MKRIKKYFDKFTPAHKKVAVLAVIMAVGGLFLLAGYRYKSSGQRARGAPAHHAKKVTLDTRLLEKAYSENIEQELKKRDMEMARVKALMEELKLKVGEDKGKSKKTENAIGRMGTQRGRVQRADGRSHPFPLPPGRGQHQEGRRPFSKVEKPKPVGGIEIVGGAAKGAVNRRTKKPLPKEKKRTVYLPPSFMDATLLTGFSAATMQSAKTYEKPLLLRVKDLAILPNEVKANLKGCFIIASAYGDLADERAHARLVNLSCIGRNGQSVIDAGIKGFIVDSDGKIGLSGNVVTKVGALLGRSVVAGFFGGIGDAFRAASTTTSISSLGATQTIDSGQLVQAGVGGGLSEGFGQIQKFYLDMAKQTFPVIEVGATKNVTVVIEEGVELEIKKYCVGGFDKCTKNTER